MELRNYSKNYTLSNLIKSIMILALCTFSIYGCTESISDGLPYDHFHSLDWGDNPQHGQDFALNTEYCKACHGDDLNGGSALVSCLSCHHSSPSDNKYSCQGCHGDYTGSAHGNTNYGVDRTSTGYTQGECIHCHDLASGSTNEYSLFAPMNGASQTDNFCFQCHQDTSASVQTAMPNQYSYSYRASGDATLTTPDDVLEAFSTLNSSHNLSDISAFITGRWGYTADSNSCSACHNPHRAKRDPHADGDRGWPVSLPSDHTDTSIWGLWGDDTSERMSQYIADKGGAYQAPNADSGYEPDGSAAQDGSNLTDYVTFCTECHNSSNTIYSTALGRNLRTIDWTSEKHGGGAASDEGDYLDVRSPYDDTQCGIYVLTCTDCHEPHGSTNIYLIRDRVNNEDVTVLTGSGVGPEGKQNREWMYLCRRCHDDTLGHFHSTAEENGVLCTTCHQPGPADIRPCGDCHYHGNTVIDGIPYNGREYIF